MAARKKASKSRAAIYRNMSAIRSADTKAEVKLRSALHRQGVRFRKNVASLPGRPDIVFRSKRLAIFIDGDFWHAREYRHSGDSWIKHAIHERARPYWSEKMARRVRRDDEVTMQLVNAGWHVLRVWESELRADHEDVVRRILTVLRRS